MIEQGPSDHPIDGPTADDGGGAGGDAAGVGLQDAALAASLAELSQLSTGRVGLVEQLTRVAKMAVQAIPGAEGAGLTLLEPKSGERRSQERRIRPADRRHPRRHRAGPVHHGRRAGPDDTVRIAGRRSAVAAVRAARRQDRRA